MAKILKLRHIVDYVRKSHLDETCVCICARDFDFDEFQARQDIRRHKDGNGIDYMVDFMMKLAESDKTEVKILFGMYIYYTKKQSPSATEEEVRRRCRHNILYTAQNSIFFRDNPNVYNTLKEILN